MKYTYLFLCAVFLVPFVASAQSNYKPGYIVNLRGDTLKGYINYREWEKNPAQVTFRNSSGNVEDFTVHNAKAFAVDGLEYYEQHTVSVSTDPVELGKLMPKSDSNFVTKTVFLKLLMRGKFASLYYYNDDVKPRFYLSDAADSGQPDELGYHVYYTADNSNALQYINRYRTQLQYEAQKNNVGGIESLIDRARYDVDDLISIISKINGGSGQQMVSQSLFGTRWFAGAGLNYNDMLFTGTITYGDAYSLFPKVSVGLDILPNKSTQRFFLRVEAAFTGDSHDFKDKQTELKVNQVTASAIFQAYYSFYNSEKLKIFAGGGIAVNFSAYPVHYYIADEGIDLTLTKNTGYPDYHPLWESFIVKAGVILNKKIEIYAGYSPPTTLTNNYADLAGDVVSYQAGINYLFGSK